MAFFTKSLDSEPAPAPLDLDRLADVLTSDEINVGYSSDRTRLGGYFGDHLAEFILYGDSSEILQLRLHWGRPLGIEHRPEMLDLLNSVNSERIWPKVYVDVEDGLAVMAEHAVDYEHGATDAQLLLHVQCAVSSAIGVFERLDAAFPEAVAQQQADHVDQSEGLTGP